MEGTTPRQLSATVWQLHETLYCIDAGYISPWFACLYLLGSDGEYAVIETGTSHSFGNLEALMAELGIGARQVRYVIPTHVHLDHAGGAGRCMAAFPEARLVIHPRGERHMVDPAKLVASTVEVYGQQRFSELYGEILPVTPDRVSVPGNGESLMLGSRRLACHYTPGHADHHFCLWDEQDRAWFSGDMFGVSYPWLRLPGGPLLLPSTTPTQFRPREYSASLDLLASRQPRRMYLTHTAALDYSQQLVDALRQQLEHYCALARGCDEQGGQLAAALGDYSLERARQLGYRGDSAELLDLLATDNRLNAQGLAIWADREAAAGA